MGIGLSLKRLWGWRISLLVLVCVVGVAGDDTTDTAGHQRTQQQQQQQRRRPQQQSQGVRIKSTSSADKGPASSTQRARTHTTKKKQGRTNGLKSRIHSQLSDSGLCEGLSREECVVQRSKSQLSPQKVKRKKVKRRATTPSTEELPECAPPVVTTGAVDEQKGDADADYVATLEQEQESSEETEVGSWLPSRLTVIMVTLGLGGFGVILSCLGVFDRFSHIETAARAMAEKRREVRRNTLANKQSQGASRFHNAANTVKHTLWAGHKKSPNKTPPLSASHSEKRQRHTIGFSLDENKVYSPEDAQPTSKSASALDGRVIPRAESSLRHHNIKQNLTHSFIVGITTADLANASMVTGWKGSRKLKLKIFFAHCAEVDVILGTRSNKNEIESLNNKSPFLRGQLDSFKIPSDPGKVCKIEVSVIKPKLVRSAAWCLAKVDVVSSLGDSFTFECEDQWFNRAPEMVATQVFSDPSIGFSKPLFSKQASWGLSSTPSATPREEREFDRPVQLEFLESETCAVAVDEMPRHTSDSVERSSDHTSEHTSEPKGEASVHPIHIQPIHAELTKWEADERAQARSISPVIVRVSPESTADDEYIDVVDQLSPEGVREPVDDYIDVGDDVDESREEWREGKRKSSLFPRDTDRSPAEDLTMFGTN